MRLGFTLDKAIRRLAVCAALAAACFVLPVMINASNGDEACDKACSDARLAKSFAADPAAVKKHVEAMNAYLKSVHDKAGAGEMGAVQQANLETPANQDMLRDARNYLDSTPGSGSASARVEAKPLLLAQAAMPATPVKPADDRTYVGEKVCTGCHKSEAVNWAHTIHSKIFDLNPQNALEGRGCEACHGPGSAHVKAPSAATIISFTSRSTTPVTQQNNQCMACHTGGARIFWHASIHETNNLACSDCHNPMAKFSAQGLTTHESVNETCFSCHKEQHAQFSRRSHMPLLEGKLSCDDCHAPHGSTTAPLLKAASVNEVCYTCHADKRGPFLFEHAPVRENCLNCHAPHGSNFETLLTTARPVLCQQCHSQTGHPASLLTMGAMPLGPNPDQRLIGVSCQTCHSEIHGSNSPAGARFER